MQQEFKRIVEVALPGVPKPLLYGVPDELELIDVGYEVAVLARARKAHGWVTGISEKRPEGIRLRPIISAHQAFLPSQLDLFRWMGRYYGYPLAETIDCAIPQFRSRRPTRTKAEKRGDIKLVGGRPENLTPGQTAALNAISAALRDRVFAAFLLFGVTGSGKTEVYLRALEALMQTDGGAIVIVPEIALTPQLIDYFETRLSHEVALLHSELSPGARQTMWERILRGELRIVLGARSAIFAPVRNLRFIAVDEEHESSFKQSDSLRYNARDVAVVLAKQTGSVAVLGSATPSFESLMNVKRGAYNLLELKERANAKPVPAIEVVDLSKVRRAEMISPNLSPRFYDLLRETLSAGEQAIILYNRRGFASYLQCESCQEVVLCPNCSITLTYHRGQEQVLCHYCGIQLPLPTRCRVCLDPRTTSVEDLDSAAEIGKLALRGAGTEKVIEEIRSLFPETAILQMDRDSITSKEGYREILTAMRSGKAQLLVGTQMIAKGHDLPDVTFVGIIDADIGLSTPDFRASERVLQLITQAAGRAGRGLKAGRVLIQTRQARHPTIVAAASGRFMAFARFELERRKALSYPPFGRLMRLIVSSPDAFDAERGAGEVSRMLEELIPSLLKQHEGKVRFSTLGPAPAPHEKLRGRFRHHFLVKCSSAAALSQLAGSFLERYQHWKNFDDLRVAVDIDPVEML